MIFLTRPSNSLPPAVGHGVALDPSTRSHRADSLGAACGPCADIFVRSACSGLPVRPAESRFILPVSKLAIVAYRDHHVNKREYAGPAFQPVHEQAGRIVPHVQQA
jgi:hypothetical protein